MSGRLGQSLSAAITTEPVALPPPAVAHTRATPRPSSSRAEHAAAHYASGSDLCSLSFYLFPFIITGFVHAARIHCIYPWARTHAYAKTV